MNKLHKYLLSKSVSYKAWYENENYRKKSYIAVSLLVLFVLLISFVSGGYDKKVSATLLPTRPFYLSFTSFAPAATTDATTQTYSFINSHADMMTFHMGGLGVPWVEAYNNDPLPQNL